MPLLEPFLLMVEPMTVGVGMAVMKNWPIAGRGSMGGGGCRVEHYRVFFLLGLHRISQESIH